MKSSWFVTGIRHEICTSFERSKNTSIFLLIIIWWRRKKLFPFRRNFNAFCSSFIYFFVGRFKLFLDAQTSFDCRFVVDYNNYYMPDLILLNWSTDFCFFVEISLFHRWWDWDADWYRSIVMHGIVYAKAAEKEQNKLLYFCTVILNFSVSCLKWKKTNFWLHLWFMIF